MGRLDEARHSYTNGCEHALSLGVQPAGPIACACAVRQLPSCHDQRLALAWSCTPLQNGFKACVRISTVLTCFHSRTIAAVLRVKCCLIGLTGVSLLLLLPRMAARRTVTRGARATWLAVWLQSSHVLPTSFGASRRVNIAPRASYVKRSARQISGAAAARFRARKLAGASASLAHVVRLN